METLVQPLSVRDVAFRAIGRNMVNFQKLEKCLKALVRLEYLAAPMSTIKDALVKRKSKASGYTLGKALQEWLRVAALDAPRSATQDLFEPWISLSFLPSIDRERLAEHGEALNALAKERNNLVHQDLANFDFDSAEGCQTLVERLDKQNARILEQLNFLAPAIRDLVALKEWTMRPEFQDELFNEFLRQRSHDET